MIERPILFSSPMIRAILAGTKTQTRRIMKPPPAGLGEIGPFDCRHGLPGDRLWVRETFAQRGQSDAWVYKADSERSIGAYAAVRWKPSIHMPRRASRITIEITGTRPERLQDISKEDVLAEGVTHYDDVPVAEMYAGWHQPFAALWEEINGPGSWAGNPLVWVVAFRRIKP
jgi:hypothetical protein